MKALRHLENPGDTFGIFGVCNESGNNLKLRGLAQVEEMVMDVKGLLIDIGMIIVMIIGVVEVTDVDHLHHDAVVEMMGVITEVDILVTEEVT